MYRLRLVEVTHYYQITLSLSKLGLSDYVEKLRLLVFKRKNSDMFRHTFRDFFGEH